MDPLHEYLAKVAALDLTFSAPKSVSLTALVGGDERLRETHQQSVAVALDELERYVQARIGGNLPPETTGRWVAAVTSGIAMLLTGGLPPPCAGMR